jgi:hypothetical protein
VGKKKKERSKKKKEIPNYPEKQPQRHLSRLKRKISSFFCLCLPPQSTTQHDWGGK